MSDTANEAKAIARGLLLRDSLDVAAYKERQRQLEKWGEQSWDLVEKAFLPFHREALAEERHIWQFRKDNGQPHTWDNILLEEVYEVFTAPNDTEARKELVQVMAVCKAIVEDLDRRATRLSNAKEGSGE